MEERRELKLPALCKYVQHGISKAMHLQKIPVTPRKPEQHRRHSNNVDSHTGHGMMVAEALAHQYWRKKISL